MPAFVCSSHPVPARTNVLGAKGCGEAGCAGALPAVMNALLDALRQVGRARTSTCRRRRSGYGTRFTPPREDGERSPREHRGRRVEVLTRSAGLG